MQVVRKAMAQLQSMNEARGIQLVEVASGYRFQVSPAVAPYLIKAQEDKPTRYSRALLETLAIIAYRQPITRGEIEDIRGVTVSTDIVRTLLERGWIKEVGVREVPGRPALLGTTREFLEHFNLKSLADMPPLAELRSIEEIGMELDRRALPSEPNQGSNHAQAPSSEATVETSSGGSATTDSAIAESESAPVMEARSVPRE